MGFKARVQTFSGILRILCQSIKLDLFMYFKDSTVYLIHLFSVQNFLEIKENYTYTTDTKENRRNDPLKVNDAMAPMQTPVGPLIINYYFIIPVPMIRSVRSSMTTLG